MKNFQKIRQKNRELRLKRTRAKVIGTQERPRLSVARTLKHIYAQLVDDGKAKTLVAASDLELKKSDLTPIKNEFKNKEKTAYATGLLLAKKAKEKKIDKVVFDRRGFKYHGRLKALAQGAREGGLIF